MCGGFLGDAFDFTKSIFQEALSDPFKFITPGFDPILGNPLKGDFMSGDAVITPTGNFTGDVWSRMYDRAGEDTGFLDRFNNYNQIADQIAPAIAGYYGGGALSGLGQSAGGAGSSIGTSGASTGGTLMGDLGGMTPTGTGWGAVGSNISGGSGTMSGSLLGDLGGLQSASPGLSSSVMGMSPNSLGNLFGNIQGMMNSPLGQTIQGGFKLGSGIMDYLSAQDARKAYKENTNQLRNLFSPTSPYAIQARQAMERRDAAKGRRSQYGPRETQLAALLTDKQASVLSSPSYVSQLGASKMRSAGLGGLFGGANQLFKGLGGLF